MAKDTAPKTESVRKEVKASARHLHISARKMRLVTNLIKNRHVSDALVQLQHLDKKASPMVVKLLRSAIANAKNNFSMDPEKLVIKSITADQGPVLKRYFPRARGSAFVIRHKLCHVNVVLEEQRKGKPKVSRLALFNRQAQALSDSAYGQAEKQEAGKTENVDQQAHWHQDLVPGQAATQSKAPKEEGKKSQIFKSEEQVKQSRAQQKRRLFNRKGGE